MNPWPKEGVFYEAMLCDDYNPGYTAIGEFVSLGRVGARFRLRSNHMTYELRDILCWRVLPDTSLCA